MSKAKGTRIERKVRRRLEGAGYVVLRSPASLGVFDLLAWRPAGHLLAIQVKGGRRPWCSPAEREAMALEALPAGARRELWCWTDYARDPVITVIAPGLVAGVVAE